MPIIARLSGVTRKFGTLVALDDINVDIHSGTVVGLLGPNGAGKSTFLSLLQGLRVPDTGTVEVCGGNPREQRFRVHMGSTPQETALPTSLRVGEVLDYVAGHYPAPRARSEIIAEFDLAELLPRQTGSLSGGQQRRVSVALAFMGDPRIVLLDEPTTGLDIRAREALWDTIRAQNRRGVTVVLTSHYLEELEALAERVIVLDHGKILADDSMAQILGRVQIRRIHVRGDPEALGKLPGVDSVTVVDGDTILYSRDTDALLIDLVNSKIPFSHLTVRGAQLDEAFRVLTESPERTAS